MVLLLCSPEFQTTSILRQPSHVRHASPSGVRRRAKPSISGKNRTDPGEGTADRYRDLRRRAATATADHGRPFAFAVRTRMPRGLQAQLPVPAQPIASVRFAPMSAAGGSRPAGLCLEVMGRCAHRAYTASNYPRYGQGRSVFARACIARAGPSPPGAPGPGIVPTA